MKYIAILRHGEAESIQSSDAERALTDKGILYSRAAAETLKTQFKDWGGLEGVFYSPYVRTIQTAQCVIDAFGDDSIVSSAENILLGDRTPLPILRWLENLPCQRILLVSHQPLVSCLADCLVRGGDTLNYNVNHDYPFYPSSLATLSMEVAAQGCADLLSLVHNP